MGENNKKSNSIYKDFMIIIITALITCIITTIVVYGAKNTPIESENENFFSAVGKTLANVFSSNKNNSAKEMENKMKEIDEILNSKYIGEIKSKKQFEGALEGYVNSLGDEYTEYLTEEEVKSLMEDVDGSYVGIGVYITSVLSSNEILVLGVINDSPAQKAGLIPGDIIKKVDDVEYTGEQLTAASNKMKGEEGTKVKVTVARNGEIKEFDILREKIKFQYVSSEMLEGNVGYIKLTAFEGNCASDFKKEYEELQKKGAKSLIIDLRNNGGGLVDQCLTIADYIVPKGATTLVTEDKNKKEQKTISNNEPIINVPIVILVNEYSASASEILTAAIKENTNAKVVGTKTYGKGVIQGIYLLNDKKTGLKVTIEEYFTPKHNKINKQGIEPDINIELPEDLKKQANIDKKEDIQLKKALEILK